MSERFPQGVRAHSFPELQRPRPEVPEWMRSNSNPVAPARFDGRPHEARDERPEGAPAQANVREDAFLRKRAALAKATAALEAEQAALAAEREELDKAKASLAHSVLEIATARDAAVAAVSADISDIAVSVARAILVDEFNEAPERALALAKAAVDTEADATLRVGPALHIALLESSDAPPATLDTSLEPYGCVAESPSKRVLAGLEVRLGEVLRALREAT